MDRTIRSLNEEEYEKLLDAMKKHEGWREGREEYTEIEKIEGVHLNKQHVITEFFVGNSSGSRWISKTEAIALAAAGALFAIVVHTKAGAYLRPKRRQTSFGKMVVESFRESAWATIASVGYKFVGNDL